MVDLVSEVNIDASDVQAIISTSVGTGTINAFINMAYYMTLPMATLLGNCGGTAALQEIQKLITAHLLTLQEPEVQSESIGGEASATYRWKTDMGLNGSRWGQMAIAMDCSGYLSSLDLKKAEIDMYSYYDF